MDSGGQTGIQGCRHADIYGHGFEQSMHKRFPSQKLLRTISASGKRLARRAATCLRQQFQTLQSSLAGSIPANLRPQRYAVHAAVDLLGAR